MKKTNLLPMNLQFFADGDGDNSDQGADNSGQNQQQGGTDHEHKDKEGESGKTFTRDDVAKMIAAETKKARKTWEKELEDKQAEAKKLAEMNDLEKADHEKQKLQDKIDQLEREANLREMSKEASKMLSEQNLTVADDLLDLIVTEDAEETKKRVGVIAAFASQIKKENVRQKTPGAGGQFSKSGDDSDKKSIADMAKEARLIKN